LKELGENEAYIGQIKFDTLNRLHVTYTKSHSYGGYATATIHYLTISDGIPSSPETIAQGEGPFIDIKDGTPYISYLSPGSCDYIMYSVKEGGFWHSYVVTIDTGICKANPGISVGADGSIHLTYSSILPAPPMVKYITNKTGSWRIEFSTDGAYPYIDMGPYDGIHITYHTEDNRIK
jgi:hypothetical protein